MMRNLLFIVLAAFSTQLFSQNISFTFANARNTNDGTNDYYEADIYIASDTDFIVGSGQIYFNYSTEAFGENVHTNTNFEMLRPTGSILETRILGAIDAYQSFIVNDNTTSRVSTSFQQLASSGTIGMPVVGSTPTHLYSIKIKYADVSKDPNVTFETGGVFLDQFYTACGPTTVAPFASANCTSTPGSQITGDSYDSAGAALPSPVNWTGNSSTLWGITSNWSDLAIPDATKNVTVQDVTNDPVLNSGSYVVNDLIINSGADLSIDTDGRLNVNGDLTNNGSISLTASASDSGVFIVDGSATGQVTFQQNGLTANEWTVITAPVSGQSIKEFAENAANDIRVNTSVTPNRYAIAYYDDSNADGAKWVYYTTNDLTTDALEFEIGKGYAISRATDGGVSFTGTIETGDVTETVTESEWNAIGNPYTAYMPVNDTSGENFIANNSSKFDPSFVAIYTWDNTQNKYAATTLLDAESKIAPGQGFFVRTNSGVTDMTFTAAQRGLPVSSGGSMRPSRSATDFSFELVARANTKMVKTKILYNNSATKGLDAGYDIGNFGGASFDIYSKLIEGNADQNYTIQSLPMDSYGEIVIPIGVVAQKGEEIAFSIDADQLPTDATIYIEDKVTNTFNEITKDSFTITLDEALNGSGRFYIHTSAKTLSTDDIVVNNESISIFKSAKSEITITGVISNAQVKVYSILGTEVSNAEIAAGTTGTMNLENLSAGVYIVKLQTENSEISKKIILE
ncbi:T9SS type A sorting domain-containing protein [Tenacibaculum sp. 190524A05c]|uniref:T9SS type A sorting domain-containing protein n=1 Tax=Tenacibaculum platacis TaxID=3137852 RepID=UPI0032B10A33